MKNIIQIIIILLTTPSRAVWFDEPVIVKKEQVSIFECWGAALNDTIWLMDEQGQWHELSEKDQNAELVINSIHQRLASKKELEPA